MTAAEYAEEKKIGALLESIFLSLLESRPSNPQRHIIEFLAKSEEELSPWPVLYPDSAQPSRQYPRRLTISRGILSRTSAALRRNAISSKMNSSSTPSVKLEPKNEPITDALSCAFRDFKVFSFLQEDQRKTLVEAMYVKDYKDGDYIMRQGDPPDSFYVIFFGQCRILSRSGDTEKAIALLNPGQGFGELALLSGSKRTTSAVAVGEVTCWAIDQQAYLFLLKEGHNRKRERYRSLLRRVPFLKVLVDYEISLIADALSPVNRAAGAIIIRQNELGNEFFMVLEGDCVVSRVNGDSKEERLIGKLAAGGYFGEVALMIEAPRAATIRAGDQGCQLVKLERAVFHRLIGPCSVFFTDNAKRT
jgi:cAMP-dependent protein kinase regulator